MKEDQIFIDSLLHSVKALKAETKRRDRISATLRDSRGCTHKRIQKLNADLNWSCMEVDKRKTDIARLFKGSIVDVGVGEKIYRPSAYHEYKY